MNWRLVRWYLVGIWLIPLLNILIRSLKISAEKLERTGDRLEALAESAREYKQNSRWMRLLGRFDDWLIDSVFQPVSDWWKDVCGKSNFWIAKTFGWFGLVIMSWNVVANIAGKGPSVAAFAIFFGVVYCGFMFRSITIMGNHVSQIEEVLEAARSMNPIRVGMAEFRIKSLHTGLATMGLACISVGGPWEGLFIWLTIFWFTALLPMLYFMACTPKPRGPLRPGNELAAQVIGR